MPSGQAPRPKRQAVASRRLAAIRSLHGNPRHTCHPATAAPRVLLHYLRRPRNPLRLRDRGTGRVGGHTRRRRAGGGHDHRLGRPPLELEVGLGTGRRLRALSFTRPPPPLAASRPGNDDCHSAPAARGRQRHRPPRLARPCPQHLRRSSGCVDRRPRRRHAGRKPARTGKRHDVWLVLRRHDARGRRTRPGNGSVGPPDCDSHDGCHPGSDVRRCAGAPRTPRRPLPARLRRQSRSGGFRSARWPRSAGTPGTFGRRHGPSGSAADRPRCGADEGPSGAALRDDDRLHVETPRLVGGPVRRSQRGMGQSSWPPGGDRGGISGRIHRSENHRRRRQLGPRFLLDSPRSQACLVGKRDHDLPLVRNPRSLPGFYVGVTLCAFHAGLDSGGGRDAVHCLDGPDEPGHQLRFLVCRAGERLARRSDGVPRRRPSPTARRDPPARHPLGRPRAGSAYRRRPSPRAWHRCRGNRGRPAPRSGVCHRADPHSDRCPSHPDHFLPPNPGRKSVRMERNGRSFPGAADGKGDLLGQPRLEMVSRQRPAPRLPR